MKQIKRGIYSLLFVLSLIASLVVSPSAANAASDYDNFLQVSPTLYVYTDGSAKSQKMDISQTWWAEFKQAYAKRVAENLGWPTNFVTEFEDIMASGGSWGVFMHDAPQGNTITIVGTHDSHAHCAFVGSVGEGSYQCRTNPGYDLIRASYFTHNSFADYGCYGSGGNRCSDTGMGLYSVPTLQPNATSWYSIFDMPNTQLPEYRFFIMNFDLTYPTGYEGELIPTEPPPAKYVAMGDSYPSGEANAPYEAGTDQDSDLCHRSPAAYPRQVQNALNLGSTAFVTCSGAVSDYIIDEYNQENVEPPQAAFISSATKLITITIGGNDVGFGDVLGTCTLPTTESGTTEEKHQIEHDACVQAINNARAIASSVALRTKLETVFSGLRSLGNEDLQVVVTGYPNLFPAFSNITEACVWGSGYVGTSGRTVASDEVQGARLLHDGLNATVAAAVTATGDDHIHFVDPSSAFSGHELCRSNPWFYNVIPNALDPVGRRGSYHPNASGQGAYATVVEGAVNSLS